VADGFGLIGWFAAGYCASYVSGGVDAADVEYDHTDGPDAQYEQGKQHRKCNR
jgi:hypothetical protein